jgi:hypothetical protein
LVLLKRKKKEQQPKKAAACMIGHPPSPPSEARNIHCTSPCELLGASSGSRRHRNAGE